jgi:hypothetical protein
VEAAGTGGSAGTVHGAEPSVAGAGAGEVVNGKPVAGAAGRDSVWTRGALCGTKGVTGLVDLAGAGVRNGLAPEATGGSLDGRFMVETLEETGRGTGTVACLSQGTAVRSGGGSLVTGDGASVMLAGSGLAGAVSRGEEPAGGTLTGLVRDPGKTVAGVKEEVTSRSIMTGCAVAGVSSGAWKDSSTGPCAARIPPNTVSAEVPAAGRAAAGNRGAGGLPRAADLGSQFFLQRHRVLQYMHW